MKHTLRLIFFPVLFLIALILETYTFLAQETLHEAADALDANNDLRSQFRRAAYRQIIVILNMRQEQRIAQGLPKVQLPEALYSRLARHCAKRGRHLAEHDKPVYGFTV